MNRINRIAEKVLNNIRKNGGHWTELEMNKGGKVYIQRLNYESFEDLEQEKFRVLLNDQPVLNKVDIQEVANYINSNF